MRRQQSGDVVSRRQQWQGIVLGGMQRRGGVLRILTVLVALHHEVDDTGRIQRSDGVDRGLVVEQQHLLKGDVADLGMPSPRTSPAAANAISQ